MKRMCSLNAENGEFYQTVIVEGKPISAFIDLGSECCTIRKQDCVINGWNYENANLVLKGFAGGECMAIGKLKKVVKVQEIERPVDIIVVNDQMQGTAMIIGQSLLSQPGVKVVKRWKQLQILTDDLEEGRSSRNSERRFSSCGTRNQMRIIQEPLSEKDFHVGTQLTETDRNRFMVLVNKYRSCFSTKIEEIGRTNWVTLNIQLKEEKVVNYKPYRVPYHLGNELRQIIEDSTSEYASPALLVRKKDGSHRMCVDYRRLNDITKRENFPSPNIEEQLNEMEGGNIFISLDMMSGYYQVPIEPKSRQYTAFATPDGHYQFCRMPFGLTNAPAVFMRLMRIVMARVNRKRIFCFMDDLLIVGKSFNDSLEILESLLNVLKEAKLTLNIKKCTFFSTSVTYLGYIIEGDGLRPGTQKTEAIKQYPIPSNIRELRQFLGLTGYFRRFVPRYATIAAPLNELLRKDKSFLWTDLQQTAYEELRKYLSEQPILTIYNPVLNHELHTDACATGLAGILFQIESDGNKRVVSYYSRATTEAERKFHSYELEALAVVESLERFKFYVLGKQIKIVTDCNSLKMTQQKKDLVPRIARWWLRIQEFDFVLEYRAGKQMSHVDALSRVSNRQDREIEEAGLDIMVVGSVERDWVMTLQMKDREIQLIHEALDGTQTGTSKCKNFAQEYQVKNSKVFKKTKDGLRLVVPRGLRWRIIRSAHDDIGHGGIDRTLEEIGKTYWFSRMRSITRKYIDSCVDCLYNKRYKDETHYQLNPREVKPVPFYVIHLDHLGPYPKSLQGNEYILGIIDAFTKFIVLKSVKSTKTQCVIRIVEDISQYFGMPEKVVTDRGTSFTSSAFEQFCSENSIKHIKTAVKTPRANGQIERYFRTVSTAVSSMTKRIDGRDWDQHIPYIQWGLNSLSHRVTGQTPQKILFGFQPKSILKNKLTAALQVDLSDDEDYIPLSELRQKVAERISQKSSEQANTQNSKRKAPTKYEEDDLVLIRYDPQATGKSRKHLPRYKGPYIVTKVIGKDRYVIADPPGVKISGRAFQSIYTADRLKPCTRLEDFEEAERDFEVNSDEERELESESQE